MSERSTTRRCHSPVFDSLVTRLLVFCTVAFYLQYVPLHLATELHWRDHPTPSLKAPNQDAALTTEYGDDHDHDHRPHAAADHSLQILPKETLPFVVAVPVAVAPLDFSVPPLADYGVRPSEWLKPPGESPPSPARPRAPPLA